jgi:D-alanyl-D-alanine carboxypeptidase/D-alanyl-D-alanine-endopeptidase (penicillin-binding protein 4)
MSMAEPVPGCKSLCWLAWVTLSGGILGCPTAAPRPTPVDHPAPAPQPPRLQQAMQQTLLPLAARGVHVGFLVVDALDGRVLAAHGAESLFTPASTLKLVTTAAVLDAMDGGQRFTTRLVSASPDAQGRIPGDITLLGDGDPSLGSTRFMLGNLDHDRVLPWDVLGEAARAMAASGVKSVGGGAVGDGRALRGGSLLPGWAWDDAAYAYSAVPSGLTLHEGLSWLRAAALEEGTVLTLTPPTSLVHPSLLAPPPDGRGLELFPRGDHAVDLAFAPGPVRPVGEEPVAIPDPVAYAAEQLDRALRGAGVTLEQPARVAGATHPDATAFPHTWLTVESPTLRTLCAATNQHSINLYAETLLMQLGRFTQDNPTTAGGLVAVRAYLQKAGVAPESYRVVDGSGLSRMNLLAPSHLVAALRQAITRDPTFVELLSVAGVRGSLKDRLVGTPAAGRVYAKTGALTGHRTMAGAVQTLDGRWLLFAFMTSGVVVGRGVVDLTVDQALLTLVTSSS